MKVFLSGITTTPYAREFLLQCASVLRGQGIECYTPVEGSWQPGGERAEGTVDQDYQALVEADALMAVLDGFNVNDGVAGHIGTFHALMHHDPRKKGILGILHDTRVARWDWKAGASSLNYYILGCIQQRGRVHRSFTDAFAELLQLSGRDPLIDGESR